MRGNKRSAWAGVVTSLALIASGIAVAAPAGAADASPRAVLSPRVSANPACQPNTYLSGSYTYVSFDDTGTCDWAVPYGVTSVDYLVVAGGGGGGVGRGGGGGAGGLLDDTGFDVSSVGLLTITVGAGGAGGTADVYGGNGSSSSLVGSTSVTALGGGAGGSWNGPVGGSSTSGQGSPGKPGGSGGGGSAGTNTSNPGGSGSSGQGFDGASATPNKVNCAANYPATVVQYCAGGGGGGAGGAGQPGHDDTVGGDGGVGRSVAWMDLTTAQNLQIGDDSGGFAYFAGGGGGGAYDRAECSPVCGYAGGGGAGGGGAGGVIDGTPAGSGLAATGGGGGGNEGATGPGGSGGSGVVALRYVSSIIPACSPADDTTSVAGQTLLAFTGVGQCQWNPPTGVDTIWYLLVGGGGGGGAAAGGGGGGGALRDDSNVSIAVDSDGLVLTVGAGGLAGAVDNSGGQGIASSIEIGATTYTAPGGLGGGSGPTSGLSQAGGAGGSGGAATAVGGAGGTGATSIDDTGSNGSNGPTAEITGATLNYAGGGGGGPSTDDTVLGPTTGGLRGGGNGARGNKTTSNPGQPGTDGLGGGGGGGQTGGANEGAGGRGGSGLIIIRYTTPIQTQLSVATSASGATYGAAFTTQPQVSIDDSVGTRVTTDDTTVVTARILNGASVVLQEDTATAVNGLVTFSGLGFNSAVLAGDDTIVFSASGLTSVDDTVTVAKATPASPSWAAISKSPGDPAFTLIPPSVVGVYGNSNVSGTWSYSSDDTAVADISGSTVTVGAEGTANITGTFTPAATGLSVNYNGTTATTTITVATPVPPTPPSRVPGPPRSVTATPGDSSITVSWQPPTDPGSFAVTSYQARVQPGGQTCLVSTPTLTCTISGLTNGTAYTVEVKALNGAGWGPWSDSAGPVTPTPNPKPPTPSPVPVPPLGPGDSDLEVDRTPKPVEVDPNAKANGLDVTGDTWTMTLEGLDGDRKPLDLGPKGVLVVDAERDVRTTGTSFKPGSFVTLYVDPPTQVTGTAARLTETIELGTLAVGSDGTFAGSRTLPDGITPGDHVLQAIGYGPGGEERALSIGIVVQAWIVLDQGTRVKNGRHDRIRTGGTTGGIDEGARLMPYIRYSNQDSFSGGKAQIKVQADGSYLWTRKIRKDRGLAAYIAYQDVVSNRVFWAKIR